LHGASVFVRWIGGSYQLRKERRIVRPGHATVDDEWLDEANIQRRVVQWLKKEGWRVVREASGREHGTDIDATRGDSRLSVEVKGHPRKTYVFGAKVGQKKRWHAGAQTRTYYGNALHSALVMVHADQERTVAIALPNVPDYRRLFERSKSPLARLGIQVWFVSRDGFVDTGENGFPTEMLGR
jgi:Holliday junction resolvase